MKKKTLKIALASRWAIRQDEAIDLASSGFGEDFYKEDGQVQHENNVTMREDGIAVIHVDGSLSYRSDLFTAWFGMDTYNSIEESLDKCASDERVKGILIDINSPGGEVSGCADLANKIFSLRGKKEFGIVARTGGLMCSAAYWLGSSCDKVFTAENGTLGSIGVLCAYNKSGKNLDVIVSDLSPNKAATPDSENGLALVKKELNDLAEVFINAVAKNRDTTFEDVLENYGKGGVFIGQKAVDAGLADGVASLEEVCELMKTGMDLTKTNNQGATMAAEEKKEEVKAEEVKTPTAEEIAKNAVAEYKKSIADVKALFDECAVAEDAVAFVDSGKTLADAKEFAFNAMKETIAKKDEEIASLKAELAAKPAADSNLSEEQKKAIAKGLEAEANAANGVHGGAGEMSEDAERKAIDAAFAKGFRK